MSSEGAKDFDPYYEWLTIPKAEQPPNHYRLLGLSRFESNANVIENAFDQRMAFVRQKQIGPNRFHAEKILNELAIAQRVLLNASQRAEYDAQLRQSESPKQIPPVKELPKAKPISIAATPTPAKSKTKKNVAKPFTRPALLVGAGVVAAVTLFVVVLTVVLSTRGSSSDDNKVVSKKSVDTQEALKQVEPKSQVAKIPDRSTKTEGKPASVESSKPANEVARILEANPSEMERAPRTHTIVPTAPADQVLSPSTIVGQPYFEGDELVTNGGDKLLFGDPSWTDYTFTVESLLESRNGPGSEITERIAIVRANGQRNAYWDVFLGSWGNQTNFWTGGAPWLHPNRLPNKRAWQRLEITARQNHILVKIDEQKIEDHSVDWKSVDQGRVGVFCNNLGRCRWRNPAVKDLSGKVLLSGWPKTALEQRPARANVLENVLVVPGTNSDQRQAFSFSGGRFVRLSSGFWKKTEGNSDAMLSERTRNCDYIELMTEDRQARYRLLNDKFQVGPISGNILTSMKTGGWMSSSDALTTRKEIESNLPRLPRAIGPGEWVDLLEWSEGVNWASLGTDWNSHLELPPRKENITLRSMQCGRFPLPAVIDGDYELELEFTRHSGTTNGGCMFPVGPHTLHLNQNMGFGKMSGVSFIDGKIAGDRSNPASFSPGPLQNGAKCRIRVEVHQSADVAEFTLDFNDQKAAVKWKGETWRLANNSDDGWNINLTRHVWLTSWDTRVTFNKARIRMLSGEIRRDSITPRDRLDDRESGLVRLVGETPLEASTGWSQLAVNQFPLDRFYAKGEFERSWPLCEPCLDYYLAHAPSSLKARVPAGARGFSVIGFNESSNTTKFIVKVDGNTLTESGVTRLAFLKCDLPADARELELVIDPAGDNHEDKGKWCYPRFYSSDAETINYANMNSSNPQNALPFIKLSASAPYDGGKHNRELDEAQRSFGLLMFNQSEKCHEFLFAHAPSSLKFEIPAGMTRFTATGSCPRSNAVSFEVLADKTTIYRSPKTGLALIDCQVPANASILELRINDVGVNHHDHSMWCYPRLYSNAGYETLVVNKPKSSITSAVVTNISPTASTKATPANDSEDLIRKRLEKAKADFAEDIDKLRDTVQDSLSAKEQTARKANNSSLQNQIVADRDEFKSNGTIPNSIPATLKQRCASVRLPLEKVYAKAIEEYQKNGQPELASVAKEELEVIKAINPFNVTRLRSTLGLNEQVVGSGEKVDKLSGLRNRLFAEKLARHEAIHFKFNGNMLNEGFAAGAFQLTNADIRDGALYSNGKYLHSSDPQASLAELTTPQFAFQSFTIALRFKGETFEGTAMNIFTGGHNFRWFQITPSYQGRLAVVLNGDIAEEFKDTEIKAGKWHVAAVGVDLENKKFIAFLDGKRAGEAKLPADFKFNLIGTDYEKTDRNWSFSHFGNGTTFHGLLDELIIYDKCLNDDEFEKVPLKN